LFPITINKGEYGTARAIGPGRSGENNKIPLIETGRTHGVYRVSLAKKGLHHHDHGGSYGAKWKPEFRRKRELFPVNLSLCLVKPLNQSVQKISGLAAVRIGKNENSFIIQNNNPSSAALKAIDPLTLQELYFEDFTVDPPQKKAPNNLGAFLCNKV
jgi:hypothetical protein